MAAEGFGAQTSFAERARNLPNGDNSSEFHDPVMQA
jgi:hypothetical protein